MLKTIVIFSFLSLFLTQKYGDNVIVNGNFTFTNPVRYTQYFPYWVLGWNCTNTCEINNCEDLMNYFITQNQIYPFCQGNVIDLNSDFINEVVSQSIVLKQGEYKLHFNYYYPQQFASEKQLKVLLNQKLIFSQKPQVDKLPFTFFYQQTIQINEGINILSFTNQGLNDGYGFKINNISLVRILNEPLQKVINNFFTFSFLKATVLFPGGRVIFGTLFGFLINLDRYQFYAYHQRIYSYNQQLLLKNINQLQSLKGMLFSNSIESVFPAYVNSVSDFMDSLNYKGQYIKYSSFQVEVSNQNFSTYIKNFIIYSLPIIIILFFALHLLFRLLFKYSVSKWIREYQFYGMFLPLIFEGTIQEITFYTFAQYKSYFSFTFGHKIFNAIIAMGFFAVILMCFAFYLFSKFHYGKKTKYVIGTKNSSLNSVISQNIEKGISVLFYGAAHQLMLSYPTLQLALLACLQIVMIIKRIKFRDCFSHHKLLLYISVSNGLFRLYFQLTTYLYYLLPNQRSILNQKYHSFFIFLIISKIVVEIFASIYYKINKNLCKLNQSGNQVRNLKKIQNKKNPKSIIKVQKKKKKKKIMKVIFC